GGVPGADLRPPAGRRRRRGTVPRHGKEPPRGRRVRGRTRAVGPMKVAVTGSTGLIGTALAVSLRADGHQVVRLVRRPPRGSDEVRWDPRAADAGDPQLDGIDACVHLAGVPVGGHRWTRRYKTEIRA